MTGKIEQGRVKVGDKVEILGLGGVRESVVTGVEAFRQPKEVAMAGEIRRHPPSWGQG